MTKIAQSVVLYMPAETMNKGGAQLGPGARCGKCMMFFKNSSECSILAPPKVSSDNGVCGLFVGGESPDNGETHKLVSIKIAGYVDAPYVPTHCGTCKYYEEAHAAVSSCKIVEGRVEFDGCCNAYEHRE